MIKIIYNIEKKILTDREKNKDKIKTDSCLFLGAIGDNLSSPLVNSIF